MSVTAENVKEIAAEISKLVEGRGWEQQARAMVEFAALYAALPTNELPAELR